MKDCKYFLNYVSESIPYYKSMGVEAELTDYPIVTKHIIRDNYEDFLCNNLGNGEKSEIVKILRGDFLKKGKSVNEVYEYKNYIFEETTGTSGVPFRVIKSKEDRVRIGLNVWRRRKVIDPEITQNKLYRFNHIGINDFNMEPYNYERDHILELYDFVDKGGFRWLHVSPNPLTEHAKILQNDNMLKFDKLQFIECTGNFYSDEQKELFEKTFNAQIVNQYGSIETWPLAYSCKCNKMHLLDNVIIEILDDNNKPIIEYGVAGNIVITCLDLRTMPFVRYKIGDYGKWCEPECECGIDTPIIEIIPGREINIIKGLEKKVFGNIVFSKIIQETVRRMRAWELIKYIQVWQISENKFNVLLNNFDMKDNFIRTLSEITKKELGKEVTIEPRYLSDTEIHEKKMEKPNVFLCKY